MRFAPSIPACQVLVVAAVPLGLSRVLYDSLSALNKPQVPGYAELIGNCATLILLASLLAPYGFLGAAYASLGGYTTSFLYLLWYTHSRLGLSATQLWIKGKKRLEPTILTSHSSSRNHETKP